MAYDPPRRAERCAVDWPIRYRLSGDNHWGKARVVNMSGSGVLFAAEEELPPQQSLEFLVLFEPGPRGWLGATATGRGRVVRSERSVAGGVAVRFED